MGYSNGIVTAPISVYDIRRAVGLTTGDLGTLIQSGYINMWAKYKPVQKAIVDTYPQLNSDKTWNVAVSDPWWKGVLGDYGIAYLGGRVQISFQRSGIVDALTTLATKIDGSLNGWVYLRPSGGSGGPYRYLDFNRYNRNAPQPIGGVSASDVIASSKSAYSIQVQFRDASQGASSVDTRDNLVPSDVIGSGWKLGIAIFKKSGSTYTPIAWVTHSSVWNGLGINSTDGADGIISQDDNIAITKLRNGTTYYALPIYSTATLAQPAENQSRQISGTGQYFLTIPYTNFVSFTATQKRTSQSVAVPKITNHKVTKLGYFSTVVQLDSTVRGYGGGTASGVTVQVVNENYNGTIAQGNYALYEYLGNISVGSDEVKTIYTISSLALDLNHTWRVMVSVNGEWATFMLITPPPLAPV